MKIKSLLLMMLTVCLMVCLCACDNDTNPADNSSTTTQNGGNSTNATTTTTQITTTTTTANPNVAVYKVTVVDEAGNPISGAFVQLCLESCTPCMTNAEGVATYQMPKADYKVSFINVPEGYSVDTNEFHFDEGSYEMTIVLKAVA